MELRAPWHLPRDAPALERQLAKEISPGHLLASVGVKAIAQRQDRDDVLFQLLDGSSRVAVVHLTYAASQSNQWPHTTVFADINAWHAQRMIPDSEEFNA